MEGRGASLGKVLNAGIEQEQGSVSSADGDLQKQMHVVDCIHNM